MDYSCGPQRCFIRHTKPTKQETYTDMAEKSLLDTKRNLARRVTAEAVGTALLLATVVGSGIMGERLAGGNVAIALLANTVATGATPSRSCSG